MGCPKLNITDFFCFAEAEKIYDHEVTDLCFASQKINFDSETDLVYYNYRYYSPELGRWLSRDPINEAGGVNLYAMVGNGVVNKWDKLGLGIIDLHFKIEVSRKYGRWVYSEPKEYLQGEIQTYLSCKCRRYYVYDLYAYRVRMLKITFINYNIHIVYGKDLKSKGEQWKDNFSSSSMEWNAFKAEMDSHQKDIGMSLPDDAKVWVNRKYTTEEHESDLGEYFWIGQKYKKVMEYDSTEEECPYLYVRFLYPEHPPKPKIKR